MQYKLNSTNPIGAVISIPFEASGDYEACLVGLSYDRVDTFVPSRINITRLSPPGMILDIDPASKDSHFFLNPANVSGGEIGNDPEFPIGGDGSHKNAVVGFLSGLARIRRESQPIHSIYLGHKTVPYLHGNSIWLVTDGSWGHVLHLQFSDEEILSMNLMKAP